MVQTHLCLCCSWILARRDFQLGYRITSFLPRFTFRVATPDCRGNAFTTAPVGRDLHPYGRQVVKVLFQPLQKVDSLLRLHFNQHGCPFLRKRVALRANIL